MKLPDCKEPSERGTENGVQRCGSPYCVGILVTIAHFMSSHVYKHTLCINGVQLAYKCSNSWLLTVTELPPLASRRRSITVKLVLWLVLRLEEGLGFCVPLIAFLLLRYL